MAFLVCAIRAPHHNVMIDSANVVEQRPMSYTGEPASDEYRVPGHEKNPHHGSRVRVGVSGMRPSGFEPAASSSGGFLSGPPAPTSAELRGFFVLSAGPASPPRRGRRRQRSGRAAARADGVILESGQRGG
jgi:hypothetical protein